MPTTSNRGMQIGASPIRSLLPYARQAKNDGVHIYHLNIGQPDIETPLAARRYLAADDEPIIGYGPSEGLPELRTAIADYYQKFDGGLTSEDVLVTTGASEAILFTMMSCLDHGSQVIIPEPFYANYIGFSAMSGVDIVPITSTIDTQFTLPTIEEFEQIITDKTKAIFLCNPGNPTGQLYDKAQLQALSDLVKKYDLFLIVDEVYKEFVYDGEFTSVLSLPQIEDHVIVIDSISKVFSACGARVGCLITKNAAVKSSVLKYAQLRLCPPFHGQKLALACYAGTDHYIQSAIQTYQKRREILFNALSEIEGVTCYKPKAAFYNIAALPVDDAEDFCRWLLTDFRVNKSTLMLAPANGFYFNKSLGKSEVRIAYILNKEDLTIAIDILSKALIAYKEK